HARQATPEPARPVLRHLCPGKSGAPATLSDIQAVCAAALDVPPEALMAKDRRPKIALARQVAMYLARELTDASLPAIGRYFGGRKHSTVLHAHRRIAGEVAAHGHTTAVVERARAVPTGP